MRHIWRDVLGVVLMLAAGVAAQRVWGERPHAARDSAPAAESWKGPAKFALPLDAAEKVWTARGPWGLPPKPEPVPPPPPPPPPVPVGIVAARGGLEALFVVPGGEIRLKVGGKLPDGGRVTAITEFQVRWTDGEGNKHEHELFGGPLPPLPPGA